MFHRREKWFASIWWSVVAGCFFLPIGTAAQEWSCTAPSIDGGVRYNCSSGKGCWVIAWGNGKAQGGCLNGRDSALFEPISAEFKNAPLGDAVQALLRGRTLEVKILGDANKLVSYSTKPRPLQLVLLELQRAAGVAFEAPWLPQVGLDEGFSICINATANEAALLLQAVSGLPVDLPQDKKEARVSLKLSKVDGKRAGEELLKALH